MWRGGNNRRHQRSGRSSGVSGNISSGVSNNGANNENDNDGNEDTRQSSPASVKQVSISIQLKIRRRNVSMINTNDIG